MTENVQAVAEVVKPKLTRAEKLVARAALLLKRIETDTAEYSGIKSEIDNAVALEGIEPGTLVKIKLGRKFADKDTSRIVVATVIAVREDDDGARQYKVSHGEGFAADLAVVAASGIAEVADALGLFASDAS